MIKTRGEIIWHKILDYIAKFTGYILTVIAVGIYWFFPLYFERFKEFILLTGPIILIIIGLAFALTKHKFRAQKDSEQGVYSYDITINKSFFYLADIAVYLGTFVIIILPWLIESKKNDISDLFQAIAFFIIASQIKQMFFRKIVKSE